MAIDNTYFIDSIHLPTVILKNTGAMSTAISRYSKQYLISALGFDLYAAYITGIAETTPDQKWVDIRDGKIYEVDGIKTEWVGLENETKESFLAQFVYCEIVRQNNDYLSPLGLFKGKDENGDGVQASIKVANEYNKGIEWYNSLYDFITYANSEVSETYPNYDFTEIFNLSGLGI